MKLKILSQNLWLLPFFLSSDNNKRFQEFLKLATEMDPDIILLQEVWLRRYLSQIVNTFSNKYYITVGGGNYWFHRSGLITLSKFPVMGSNVSKLGYFRNTKIQERLSGKGYMELELDVHGRAIKIINAHLHEVPNKGDKFQDIASAQLKLIIEKINEGISIIGGDLNLYPDVVEHLLKRKFIFSSKENTISKLNPYQNRKLNRLRVNEFKCDYVLVPNDGKLVLTEKVLGSPAISDHFGVLAEVLIN